jgi:uncharacterized Fe-S cluster protein YjdI
MMENKIKKYANGEVTVVWKPSECIHSGICFHGLGEVFNPRKRPWVTLENSTTEIIIDQVKKCPSGALTYYTNRERPLEPRETETATIVEPVPNGPLMMYGDILLKDSDGNVTKKNEVTAFCRCGGSQNKPYCDGSHSNNGFTA